jgi:hypothetical protein
MTATVTITTIRCPHAEQHQKTESATSNVWLRQRPDGTLFCPVHGDIKK